VFLGSQKEGFQKASAHSFKIELLKDIVFQLEEAKTLPRVPLQEYQQTMPFHGTTHQIMGSTAVNVNWLG